MPPKTRNRQKEDHNDESSDDEQRRREEDTDPAAARSTLAPTMLAAGTAPVEARHDVIAITEDQLARLISNVMRNAAAVTSPVNSDSGSTPTPSSSSMFPPAPTGNFSRCTARFDGVSRSADEFETFVDAITVYKECTAISDEHALRGIALLLTDQAAVFWRGIKSSVTSWEDAIRRLRAMYGTPRPAHKVFREIFAREQSADDRAESFISQVRAKFAQLPYKVPVIMQTDVIYGLLNRKIRKRLPRDSVTDPDQLLERARYVEESLSEVNHVNLSNAPVVAMHASSRSISEVSKTNNDSNQSNPLSAVLRIANPSSADVRTFTPSSSIMRSVIDPRTVSDPSPNITKKRERPRCSACRRFGHVAEDCRSTPGTRPNINTDRADLSTSDRGNCLYCYGCGRSGTVRSKCETCNPTSTQGPNTKAEFQSVEIEGLDRSRPIVNIEIAGRKGVAVLDTGATHSLASPGLHAILIASGVKFTETHRAVRLADGSQRIRSVLTCETMVILQGRSILTTFFVLPGANNRTLLGRDFIVRADVMLGLPQSTWCFSDARHVKFSFVKSYELYPPVLPPTVDAELMQLDVKSLELRKDEAYAPTTTQSTEPIEPNADRDRYASERPPTTYDAYRSRVNDAQEPVTSLPYRSSMYKQHRDAIDASDGRRNDSKLRRMIVDTEADDVGFRGRGQSNCCYAGAGSGGALHRYGPEADGNDAARLVVPRLYADENRQPAPDYDAGDYDLLKKREPNHVDRRQTAKFIPRRDGPYKVTESVSPASFKLENPSIGKQIGKYHVSHITPYVGPVISPVKEKRRRGWPRKLRRPSPNARSPCSN